MTQLNYLRSGTEVQHRKLERDLDLLRVSFTREDYVGLLERFHGFQQPWEQMIETLVSAEFPGFFEARKKLRHIESDLRFLGYAKEDVLHIPICTELPELKSIGAALGSLYVMEGSTLGGRILTRHFGEQLGVRPDAGCRYFAAYGENTGAMWRAFGELLAKRPAAENDDMLSAAIATFERLGDWLSGGARAAASGAAAASRAVTHEYV